MANMVDVTRDGTRLEQLKQLALELASQLDSPDDNHSMAQLARQYRETMNRIATIEGGVDDDDEITAIILRNRKPAADQHVGAEV